MISLLLDHTKAPWSSSTLFIHFLRLFIFDRVIFCHKSYIFRKVCFFWSIQIVNQNFCRVFNNGVKKSYKSHILYHKSYSIFSLIKIIKWNIVPEFSVFMVRRWKLVWLSPLLLLLYDAIDILLKNVELIQSCHNELDMEKKLEISKGVWLSR